MLDDRVALKKASTPAHSGAFGDATRNKVRFPFLSSSAACSTTMRGLSLYRSRSLSAASACGSISTPLQPNRLMYFCRGSFVTPSNAPTWMNVNCEPDSNIRRQTMSSNSTTRRFFALEQLPGAISDALHPISEFGENRLVSGASLRPRQRSVLGKLRQRAVFSDREFAVHLRLANGVRDRVLAHCKESPHAPRWKPAVINPFKESQQIGC